MTTPHIRDFRDQRVHMIGIGGSSMSGLAQMLLDQGYHITGSDNTHSHAVERLEAEGVQRALLTLVENLQRQDMNCFETAEGMHRLIDTYGLTQEEAANRLGCSQPTIANKLRLLRLPPEERSAIIGAGLTERHARALLRIEDEELRRVALGRIIEGRLTAAQSDKLVDDFLKGKIKRKRPLPVVRDVRLFFNTVNHAVETMRRSGIEARSEKNETEDYIEYVVRIPKPSARPVIVHTA